MNRIVVLFVLTALAALASAQDVALPDVNAALGPQQSASGLYRLSVEPGLKPMRLNKLHHWNLQLRDARNRAVSGASIAVDGGMPGHGHGLPTSPRVVAGDKPGQYVLRGMRFNMSGVWELKLNIRDGDNSDQVHLQFVVTDTTGR